MNELRVFENTEFGSIRALEIDNTPYFVAKDIAEALGYSNTKDAILTHVDEEDKRIIQRSDFTTIENHIPKTVFPVNFVPADIPNRGLTIINESGVYALIFGSKLPKAKEFKHWVTSEVLPSIRNTGMYAAADIQIQQDLAKAELLNAQYKVLKLLAENPHLQNVYPVADEMETEKTTARKQEHLYALWSKLKQRCYNKNHEKYKNYGGKGATICDEWRYNFLNFKEWCMNNGYQKGKYLVRIDIKGEFSPTNCRWSRSRQNP